jgi:type I restriction enzyme S subunit
MGDGWIRLADVVQIKHGFAFEGQHFKDEPTTDVLLTPGNFALGGGFKGDKLRFYSGPVPDGFVLDPGDLVVTMTDLSKAGDTLGYPAVVPTWPGLRFLHNQRIGKVVIARPELIDLGYLYCLLRSAEYRHEVLSSATGSTVRHTSPTRICAFRFQPPSLAEQRAIGSILGALDDKIELNRRMNETLESMARALFRSWFVDFDPVRAKAEGRQPFGMDAATAALFPASFESMAPELPSGWTRAALGSWVEALSGGTPSKNDASLWNGYVPWISPKVMTEIHADSAEAFVTREAIGRGTRLAPPGSTLVMVRGMGLHEKVRVSQARAEVTFNQDVKALVPRTIEPILLLHALLDAQDELLGKVESSGHGTGKLPSEILLAHVITMPPRQVQARLATVFESFGDRIATARNENKTLAELRDLLLPRLLCGELRVREAERAVEGVA